MARRLTAERLCDATWVELERQGCTAAEERYARGLTQGDWEMLADIGYGPRSVVCSIRVHADKVSDCGGPI